MTGEVHECPLYGMTSSTDSVHIEDEYGPAGRVVSLVVSSAAIVETVANHIHQPIQTD